MRKDKTTQPPHYIVIFKAKDADNLEQAFREFTAKTLKPRSSGPLSARCWQQPSRKPPSSQQAKKKSRKGGWNDEAGNEKAADANLPYLLFVYLFAKCGQAYRLAAGRTCFGKAAPPDGRHLSLPLQSPLPSLHPVRSVRGRCWCGGSPAHGVQQGQERQEVPQGREYGSARWGTAKDIAPYIDPKFENNILLTQTERLTMTRRPKDPKTARNKMCW